jgi:hypothetical protein
MFSSELAASLACRPQRDAFELPSAVRLFDLYAGSVVAVRKALGAATTCRFLKCPPANTEASWNPIEAVVQTRSRRRCNANVG